MGGVAVTYLGDPKRPESHVGFARECGDGELTSFRRTVNRTALRADGGGGVACSHFYCLVLDAHWLSVGWVKCIKTWYTHLIGVQFFVRDGEWHIGNQG